MQIATRVLACAALSASLVTVAQIAQAAAPKVKGTYRYVGSRVCQIVVLIDKDPQGDVTNVRTMGPNHMRYIVGTMTFTGAAVNSGQVSVVLKQVGGPGLYVTSSPALALTTEIASGAYSHTTTTFNLAGAQGPVMYSNIVSGIAKTVNFTTRQDNNRCMESGTLTRVD